MDARVRGEGRVRGVGESDAAGGSDLTDLTDGHSKGVLLAPPSSTSFASSGGGVSIVVSADQPPVASPIGSPRLAPTPNADAAFAPPVALSAARHEEQEGAEEDNDLHIQPLPAAPPPAAASSTALHVHISEASFTFAERLSPACDPLHLGAGPRLATLAPAASALVISATQIAMSRAPHEPSPQLYSASGAPARARTPVVRLHTR